MGGNANTAQAVRRAMVGPQCPIILAHVWRWFSDLSNMREWLDGSPQAIKPSEIAAWSQLTGTRPKPHEIRLILSLDVRFRNIYGQDDSDAESLPLDHQQILAYVAAAKFSPRG